MKTKLIPVLMFFAVLAVLNVWAVTTRDEVKVDWRPSAYSLEVTNCIEQYEPVNRVYDFDKMSDRTNAQLAEIVGVSEATISKCRR